MDIAQLVKVVLNTLPAYRRWHVAKELRALTEDKAHLLNAAKRALVYDAAQQTSTSGYSTYVQTLLGTYDAQIAKLSSTLATTSKRVPQA